MILYVKDFKKRIINGLFESGGVYFSVEKDKKR